MLNYPEHKQNQYLHEYIDNSLKTDLSDINDTYCALGGNFWVATPRDDPKLVVGMVGLEAKSHNEGELRRMSVKSTHRRYGIGRLLLLALEHWAVEHHFCKVWLTTGGVMDKARAFYTSTGYTETEVMIIGEEPRFEIIKIEKVLAPANHAEDLNDVEGAYIAPGGAFWIATPHEELAHVVGMVGLELKRGNNLCSLQILRSAAQYRLWLTTGCAMDKARAFYISAGWKETSTCFMRVEDPLYEVVAGGTRRANSYGVGK